jgi:hypothetical protein
VKTATYTTSGKFEAALFVRRLAEPAQYRSSIDEAGKTKQVDLGSVG